MDHKHLKKLVFGYTPLPELVQALDLKTNPRQLTTLLDREIERKKEALRDLQTYRNFLGAPISALPPEILADIFYIYASVTKSLFDLKWTQIMLVCQVWRRVGLSTASLWSCLDFERMGPKRLRAQLQRSRGWPLDVKAHLYDESFRRLTLHQLLPLDPERLRSLNVHGSPDGVVPFLEQLAPSASTYPILRKLEIQLYSSEGMKQDAAPITLTKHMVSGGGPLLSELTLWYIAPPWRGVHGLTSLEVHAAAVNCDILLEVLSRCPELCVLDVDILPYTATAPRNNSARITLSTLQYLQLCADSATTCCQLLSCLNIPSEVLISLPSHMLLDNMRTSGICSLLRKHYRAEGAPQMRSLTLRVRESNEDWQIVDVNVFSFVNLARYSPDTFARSSDKTPCLSLCIAETSITQLRQALSSILDALPVRELTHIDTGYDDALSKKVWKTVLAMLPGLTTMTARADTNAFPAIEALDWHLSSKHRRAISHLRLDCLFLGSLSGGDAENNGRKLMLARAAFHVALAHAKKAKALGQPLDVIELFSDRWDRHAHQVINDMPYKEAYRLLATGFIVEGYLSNKEKAKTAGRWRREDQRELGVDREEWTPASDSEVEAELNAEEAEEAEAPVEEAAGTEPHNTTVTRTF